jgi:predicted ATPase
VIGKTLSHFRVLEKLGEGGMGEVYLARDTRLRRKVALKLLPSHLTAAEERVQRLQHEAYAASALNHPNILTIYEVGQADELHYIAAEYVEGTTLRTRMGSRAMSLGEVLDVGTQIASALVAAHGAGITHRDIKPENIMVRPDGYIKVLDFGLAKLTERRDEPGRVDSEAMTGMTVNTSPGMVLGTTHYMSPEQARGEAVGNATDVFALGIVLYELTTGKHPFSAESQIAVLHAILAQPALSPARLNPEMPATLVTLILQMLEKDARLRPTAAEVKAVLVGLAAKSTGVEASAVAPPIQRHTVGRAKERAELRAGFETATAGRGLLLCVAGEPGIGKTTLVEDVLDELQAEGLACNVARGRCSERLAGAEAYLPILEALDSLLRGDASEPAARLMKLVAPTWYVQVAPLSDDDSSAARLSTDVKAASQERMKRELSAFLQEVSRIRPLVLFFDDVHWADVSTVDLLAYLMSKSEAMRVLIVVTYRPEELLLAKHPLLPVKLDLQARGVGREVSLDFLTRLDIERYLALKFPEHRFPPELPALIHAKTEGSPLFMVDMVRYLQDRQVIAEQQGRWMLAASIPAIERNLPESVRSMIQRKIDQLSEEDRQLLVGASVEGYEFDSAVVAKALGVDPAEIEERLDPLGRVHAFVRFVEEKEFPDGTLTLRYRFVHVLYQNSLYASLQATRRAAMSAAVAQSILDFYGEQRGKVASQLAALFSAARDFARAVEFYLLAAQQAAAVYANAEAAALASRGLEMLKSLPAGTPRDDQELSLQLTRALALSIAHGYAAPEVGAGYARARELCQKMGAASEVCPVLFGLCLFYWIRGEHDSARQHGEQMVRMSQKIGDRVMLTTAHLVLGNTLVLTGELVSARENLERSISFYDPGQRQSYRSLLRLDPGIYSLAQLGRVLWLLGHPEQARQRFAEAFSLAAETGDPRSIAYTQILGTIVYTYLRECAQVRKLMDACVAHCTQHDIGHDQVWSCLWGGWALAEQGATGEGIALMQKNLAVQRSLGAKISYTEFLTLLAQIYGKAGRIEEGLAAVAEAIELAPRMSEGVIKAETQRVKGELLLQTSGASREVEAEACFHQAIVIAREQDAKSWELRAATSLARLWQKQGKQQEARVILGEIYGWFTEGFDTADLKDAKALLTELS